MHGKRIDRSVRRLRDFAKHQAPRKISYKRISSGSSLEGMAEVDYVPISKNSRIPAHAHKCANTLCVVVSGKGYVELNGRRSPLRAGNVISIPAGVYHEFGALDQKLVFISVQSPPIGDDYIFQQGRNQTQRKNTEANRPSPRARRL